MDILLNYIDDGYDTSTAFTKNNVEFIKQSSLCFEDYLPSPLFITAVEKGIRVYLLLEIEPHRWLKSVGQVSVRFGPIGQILLLDQHTSKS